MQSRITGIANVQMMTPEAVEQEFPKKECFSSNLLDYCVLPT